MDQMARAGDLMDEMDGMDEVDLVDEVDNSVLGTMDASEYLKTN